MKALVTLETTLALLKKAGTTPPGAFVEIGVYQGGTAIFLHALAASQGRSLYLYDTFSGIPHKDSVDNHEIGDFGECDLGDIRSMCPYAVVTPGIFPKSAVKMEAVAFAHLDCDQYRSYAEAIDFLVPLMIPGGVMWFDDSPCLEGAKQAVTERFPIGLKLAAGKHYVEFSRL